MAQTGWGLFKTILLPLHNYYFFNRQIKIGVLIQTGWKKWLLWGLIGVIFGKKKLRKVTCRTQTIGLHCHVMAQRSWTDFFSFSDCHAGTNERAANLPHWFQGASGCWLMKCGRTKRRLQALPQPSHNPSLLPLIELIILLSHSTLSLGFQ